MFHSLRIVRNNGDRDCLSYCCCHCIQEGKKINMNTKTILYIETQMWRKMSNNRDNNKFTYVDFCFVDDDDVSFHWTIDFLLSFNMLRQVSVRAMLCKISTSKHRISHLYR